MLRLFLITLFIICATQSSLTIASEENECRKSFIPAKETFSTCRSKMINICSCECRSLNKTDRTNCRKECFQKGLCDTCLLYTFANIRTNERILSASLCKVSNDLLKIYDEIKFLHGENGKEAMSGCIAKKINNSNIFSDNPKSLSAQFELRVTRTDVFLNSLGCALQHMGDTYIEKRDLIKQHSEHIKRYRSVLAKWNAVNQRNLAYIKKGLEMSCPVANHQNIELPPCQSVIQINAIIKEERHQTNLH